MLDLSDDDFTGVAVRPRLTLTGGNGAVPPLPPKPVKMGAGGDGGPVRKENGVAPSRTIASLVSAVPTPSQAVPEAVKAEIDRLVLALVDAGDIRFDRNRGEYVSTGVRWRFA